ncbi:MAG: hypothetical protein D6731_05190 [Planctomycetota bacterium]|nr:MAG: hypothetical protein D6731_05190 [Planctomycetota bacterium]
MPPPSARSLWAVFFAGLVLPTGSANARPAGLVISEVHPRGAEFVELHNAGAVPVRLTGYKLLGDIKHIFEGDLSIPPGGYFVVAHGPRQIAAAFGQGVIIGDALWGRLSARGGELRLYDPDDELLDWVRYGRARAGCSHQRRSSTSAYRGPAYWEQAPPTPAAPNAVPSTPPPLGLDRFALSPRVALPGQPLEASVRVFGEVSAVHLRWETVARGAGEVPLHRVGPAGGGSQLYLGTLPPLPAETLVRCRVVAEGPRGRLGLDADPQSGRPALAYVRAKESPPPLPTLRVALPPAELERLLRRGGAAEAWVVVLRHGPHGLEPATARARLEARGSAGGVRRWSKRSWRLLLERPLPGWGGRREVYLRTTWRDPTALREPLALDVYRRCGVVAPRARLVRLRANGEFVGLYTEVEAVNSDFLAHQGLAGASLFRARQPRGRRTTSPCDGRPLGSLLDYELAWESCTPSSDHRDLAAFVEGLHACAPEELEGYLRERLDTERYAAYLAATALVGHWDSTNRNFFWAYDRRGSRRWTVIPWDLDRSFGDFAHGRWLVVDDPLSRGTRALPVHWSGKETYNRLRTRFLSVPAFFEAYREALRRALAGPFAPEAVDAELARLAERAERSVLEDRARWKRYFGRSDGRPLVKPFTPFHFARGLQHLRLYLRERRRYVASALDAPDLGAGRIAPAARRAYVVRECASLAALGAVLLCGGALGWRRRRREAAA